MHKPEFQLGPDARRTLSQEPVNWEIIAKDLEGMPATQKCIIITTPENLDRDQSEIFKYRDRLSRALDGKDGKNYELRILLESGTNLLYVARKR